MELKEHRSFREFLNENQTKNTVEGSIKLLKENGYRVIKETTNDKFVTILEGLNPTVLDVTSEMIYALWYYFNEDSQEYEGLQLQVDKQGNAFITTAAESLEDIEEYGDENGIDEIWNQNSEDEFDFEGSFDEAMEELKDEYSFYIKNAMLPEEYRRTQDHFIG